MNIKTLKY